MSLRLNCPMGMRGSVAEWRGMRGGEEMAVSDNGEDFASCCLDSALA